jgi:predicted DNA-binding ribbon-helix-helix protein
MVAEGSRYPEVSSSGAAGDDKPFENANRRDGDGHLKSRVIKRSLVVGGHKTSVSLEDSFWNELRAIAHNRGLHLSQLVGSIDSERQYCNLSSAIRLFVFEHSRNRAHDGHAQTHDGHGQNEPQRDLTDSHIPRRG